MEKTVQNIGKYNHEYFEAQIQKINHNLVVHQQQISKIEDLTLQINQHTKKIAELEHKLKLIQTFQSQNFINNERLFNSQAKLDTIEKKVMILEEAQFNTHRGRPFQEEPIDNRLFQKLEMRMNQIQIQFEKSKQKNKTLSKFKRQLSPRLPNCQTTNDMSIDQGNMKTQIKKIQKKLQDTLMQKFSHLEKKYTEALQSKKHQRSVGYQAYTPNQFNRETRVKNRTNTHQSIEDQNRNKANQQPKKHFDTYYNQEIQKPNRLLRERKLTDQNHSLKPKLKSKTKKQKSSSKSLSKQKSSKKLKEFQLRNQKKLTKLSSVNEYLRLQQKNK